MAAKRQMARSSAARAYAAAQLAQQAYRRQLCMETLASLDCLRTVAASELTRLLDLLVFRAFPAGTTVYQQDAQGTFLFFLLEGMVQLHLHTRDGRDVLVGVLGRGDCCGEGALFGDFFRSSSAVTQVSSLFLQAPLSELRPLLSAMPLLNAALRRVYIRRLAETTLADVPLFSQMLPFERLALVDLLKPLHVPRGELVIRQDQIGEALYIIEAGQLAVEQNERAIAALNEGDFFGEMALLGATTHRASVRALTPVDLLALPAAEFHRLIELRPDIAAQVHSTIARRNQRNAELRHDENQAQNMALAVERGLVRGRYMLVRTPSLCPPNCRICEDACAARHGSARMRIGGVSIDGLDVVDTCRQCSVGPECVEACPEHALQWSDNGALRVTDRCTGCGACVTACPYDAVTSEPLPRSAADGPLALLWRRASSLHWRQEVIPLETIRPTHRAAKCDLCSGYDDKACLSACPTGALCLVPVEELFPL
jgi:CRP-like cAMP-binding protein/Fe-S-cluster-containing hydrogenase component 2